MTETAPYNSSFFNKIQDGSLISARQVVPTLISLFHPKSVVDLGCGTGAWLAAFQENGISDVQGIDGDYVNRQALLIPPDRFKAHDLTQPLALGRRFDLAISVEVAEHLDPSAASTFINNLTPLSDVILFSAAIPMQGGEHHVNEQWPDYWKSLFEARGYRLIDCLRRRFWNNPGVDTWYRQNLLLYVKEERLKSTPELLDEFEKNKNNVLSIVHPDLYLAPSLSTLLKFFPGTILGAIRRRFKRN